MAYSTRESIIRRVADLLASITVANGYSTDAGLSPVFRGRSIVGEEDAPALNIVENDTTIVEEYYEMNQKPLSLTIEGLIGYTSNPMTKANDLLWDIERAAVNDRDSWLKALGVKSVRERGGNTIPPGDGSSLVGAFVDVEFYYLSPQGNP